jgi:CheY-like chemotaxis protein
VPIRRLLSIDDDAEILRQRALLLEASGYSVVSLQSGEEALRLLASGAQVDLVLLDYMMPGMKGDELAHNLKRKYPGLPLVAVSATDELPQVLRETVNASVRKGPRLPKYSVKTARSQRLATGSERCCASKMKNFS